MLRQGTVLMDTYQLMERIGSGGGGIVYKAYHRRLQKYVVIKQIRDCVKGVLESRAEADILKKLSHSYLPQVYDFFEIDGEIYTVIDYIPGITLEEALKREGRFEQREVLKWANQLAQALSYLHSQNPSIIHSDIKPANIMLTPERDICLIDFNVSLAFDRNRRTSTGVSEGYSPPEQYWNYAMYCSMTGTSNMGGTGSAPSAGGVRKTVLVEDAATNTRGSQTAYGNRVTARVTQLVGRGVDACSDIYSLGATLYHLLTGIAPSCNFDEVIPLTQYQIHISEGFALIISKMMEISPDQRYQNGTELLDALQNIHKLDSTYKKYKRSRLTGGLILAGMYAMSVALVVSGISKRNSETVNAYNQEIETAESLIWDGDFERAEDYIDGALDRIPSRVDAYEKEVERLYAMADYEDCIQYARDVINSPLYELKTDADKEILGDVFYLMGNAYYEMDDYTNALSGFAQAVEYNQKNGDYYRDYCLAYAKSGNLEKAEDMLEKAIGLGISKDSTYMAQGEIAYAKGSYEESIQLFSDTLSITENVQMQRRCVLLADRAYQMLGDDYLEEDINLLEKWEALLESKGSYQITERLADAYARQGEYEKSLSRFEALQEQGYSTYQLMINLAILYQQMGRYDEAADVLNELLETYPGRYETYKRLAFLEADIQQKKDNSQRDYHKMKEYYDEADELYSQQGIQDDEMQMLASLIADAQSGGWLN